MSRNVKQSNEHTVDARFKDALLCYKLSIDTDISKFTKSLEAETSEQFGEYSLKGLQSFTEILNRGGKRIRGALTMLSYEMFGGTDQSVAIEAARAIEILQSYMLIIDDIADRSHTRRGGPSAHILVKDWHENNHLIDDSQHFGEAIATHGALVGAHLAFQIISQLNVDPEIKNLASNILNQNLIITAHGQFNDLYNEVLEINDEQAIENVTIWKTAYYTFVNPLQFGAILAGVSGDSLNTLAAYSLHAGRVFQISDDILGTFGNEFESGKSPMDDIREGKRTLLIAKTLNSASKADKYFLEQKLGDQKLTAKEFARVNAIIRQSGALELVQKEADKSASKAIAALDKLNEELDHKGIVFLEQLVHYLLNRKA